MKVRTFTSHVTHTLSDAFQSIETQIKEFLGDVDLKEVRDTLYRNVPIVKGGPPTGQTLVRVVLYAPKQ